MATLSPTDGSPTLAQALLQSSPTAFSKATRSPFLEAAGKGTLSRETLSQWLSQDRLYGQAYINFIGSLLSRVHLPLHSDKNRASLEWRLAGMLAGALENVFREARFYDDVAERYDLEVEEPQPGTAAFGPNDTTQAYMDLFRSFQNPEKGLLEGLVVLWATEKCYLEAWSYARSFDHGGNSEQDVDGGALRKEFIPNWTSKEFVDFVEDIATLLNEWAVEPEEEDKSAAFKAWEEVLDLEQNFWPKA